MLLLPKNTLFHTYSGALIWSICWADFYFIYFKYVSFFLIFICLYWFRSFFFFFLWDTTICHNCWSVSFLSINYIKISKRLRNRLNSTFCLVKFWTHTNATKKHTVLYLFKGFGLVNWLTVFFFSSTSAKLNQVKMCHVLKHIQGAWLHVKRC